jgi:hypothetical protein
MGTAGSEGSATCGHLSEGLHLGSGTEMLLASVFGSHFSCPILFFLSYKVKGSNIKSRGPAESSEVI